jgi:hypothetical protein
MYITNAGAVTIPGTLTVTGAISGSTGTFTGNLTLGTGNVGATATPAQLNTGNNYSNGTTRDKCKIYFYNSGTEQYGIGVGAASDIQHHSNGLHDFYINNTKIGSISSTGLSVTGTLAATKNANSDQSFTLTNTTAGTAAMARIDLVGDASGGQLTFAQYNTGYTGTFAGVNLAKLKLIIDNSAGGNSNGLMLASPNSIYMAPGFSVVGTFASTGLSITGTITATGAITTSGTLIRGAAGKGYLDGNYSNGIETVNTSGAIYSIGGTYAPGSTSLGNMYGVGYTYTGGTALGQPAGTPINLWGLYGAASGTANWFLDASNGGGYFNGGLSATTGAFSSMVTGTALTANGAIGLKLIGRSGTNDSQVAFFQSNGSTSCGFFNGAANGIDIYSPNSTKILGTTNTGATITGTLSVTGTITGTASGNAVAGATCTYTGTLVESAGIAYSGAVSGSPTGSAGGIATGTLDIGSNRAMTGIRSVASTNVGCCGFVAGAIYIRGYNLKNN